MNNKSSKLPTEKLARVKLVAMDVDGTFTDGTIYHDSAGEVIKGFSAQDGMGTELLRRAGILRGFITGRSDHATKTRAEYLGVDFYLPSVGDKAAALGGTADRYGITLDECLYIGDDLNDITALEAAGVAVVVANANPAVMRFADVITTAPGGHGAIREVADMILAARNIDPVELWLTNKDRPVGMR
ncbi:HAD hydrolase family protein [bacterium]|nr:HAD hydrolase family protein [bacterium]